MYNLKHRILLDKKTTKFFSVFVNQVGTECNFTTKDSWTILSPIEQSIKKKIEKVGTPLKDWNINIYRGILTGYNKAFIIDGITKDKLINEDAKSAEIIRPILRGRDIKRYSYEFADLYLITTFPSLKIDIEEYPAVKAHLLSFGYDRLKQTGEKGARKKTNNKWFETQDSIAYWEDFNRHKIAWASVGETFYSCVDPGLFLLDTNYFFSADSPEYLLGILNSKLITYWINSEDTPIGSGGAYRHYKYNLERLPIPRNEKSVIVKLVKKLLDKIDKNVLREIDLIVYSLYGLTEIEIDFIENMNI